MILTKQERHDIYVAAYNRIAGKQSIFICVALMDSGVNPQITQKWLSIKSEDVLITDFCLQYFPELALFQPEDDDTGSWWKADEENTMNDNYEYRLNALGFMIAMTE